MLNTLEIEHNLMRSIQGNLGGMFHSAGVRLSPEVLNSVSDMLCGMFAPSSQGEYEGRGVTAPADSDKVMFNVIPSNNTTSHVTDTLVVYCKGSDSLNNRLADMLIAANRHRFKNVIFVTTKWDSAMITGKNSQRLQDLFGLIENGASLCFILVSTSGVSIIPVIY